MNKKSKRSASPLPNTVNLAKAAHELPEEDWAAAIEQNVWTDAIVELGDLAFQLEDARPELSQIASIWSVLLELAQSDEGDERQRREQLCLVAHNAETLVAGLAGDPDALATLADLCADARKRWGETLGWLMDETSPAEQIADEDDLDSLSEQELLELQELEEALLDSDDELDDLVVPLDESEDTPGEACDTPDPQQLEAALAAMAASSSLKSR